MPVRGIPKIARGLKPRNSLSKLSHQRDGGSSWRKCPELLVKQTRRMSHIFAVALLFASVRLVDYLLGGRSIDTIVQYSHSSSSSSSILEDNYSIQKPAQEKIQIFYNLFTKGVDDEEHVKKIVEEQFSLLDPRYHNTNILCHWQVQSWEMQPTTSNNTTNQAGKNWLYMPCGNTVNQIHTTTKTPR